MQVLIDAEKRSLDAHQASLRAVPPMHFQPPGGPVATVTPAQVSESQRQAAVGKYHVVVTADCGLYGRWQTLVRSATPCMRCGVRRCGMLHCSSQMACKRSSGAFAFLASALSMAMHRAAVLAGSEKHCAVTAQQPHFCCSCR